MKKDESSASFDSSALQDNLNNQNIATQGAEAAFENAKLTREVAEISGVEYVEGDLQAGVRVGPKPRSPSPMSNRSAPIDRIIWAVRMDKQGYVSKARTSSDNVALQKANFTLAQAKTKKHVLVEYTRNKTLKEFQERGREGKVRRARQAGRPGTWRRQGKEAQYPDHELQDFRARAMGSSFTPTTRTDSASTQLQIEEGATVRERQKIFSLPNINKMRVNAKVHESMVDQIKPGSRPGFASMRSPDKIMAGRGLRRSPPSPTRRAFSAPTSRSTPRT